VQEIRGQEAVAYAVSKGLFVNIDETFLIQAESSLRGYSVSMAEVEDFLDDALDEAFDPTKLVKGSKPFDVMVGRYGQGWIYVALEGNHPLREEDLLLQIFEQRISSFGLAGGDILDVVTGEFPNLEDSGFPKSANLNLMFHAALRLAEKERLIAVTDHTCYGNTYFHLPVASSNRHA